MKDYANPIVVKSNNPSKVCYLFGAVVYVCFGTAISIAILGGVG